MCRHSSLGFLFRAPIVAVLAGPLLAGLALAAPGVAQEPAPEPGPERHPAAPASPPPACPVPAALVGEARGPLAAVRYLADDALEGRLAGSPGARCAAAYIADELRRLGLEPGGEGGGYFQPVPLASHANPHAPGGAGRNVVAILPGADPARADEAVVVGAHFDHLGRGGFGSLGAPGEIHNGADDNASGVAALLEAAARLARGPRPARTVVLVAFTGEEQGLLGSSRYVAEPSVPLERTVAMLNLDMVGRLGEDPLIVYGTGTAAEWEGILSAAAREAGVETAFQESGYGPSDHTSFYAKRIPVLHFFTNVHGDYHRPSDDWEEIDVAGVERVGRLAAAVARAVADRPAPLTVRADAGPPPEARAGYGSYLGTIPDFAPVERGVRISGVGPGSPAEAAGLRGGDIIVGLGAHEIDDLYDLTDALRAHQPGDTVRVVVLREGREAAFTAVLGSREERERPE